ncbi:hypothetical protein C8R42DRAFT_725760 [Lentinula raphanica]|nr:hypothetical protein C8R42DRAFT_725760 [Lentinula raphanica]
MLSQLSPGRSLSPLTPIEDKMTEEISDNQKIILFVRDNRAPQNISSNRIERLLVPVIKKENDSLGFEYWVNGVDVFEALQETASAITGDAIVTVPSQESPELLPGTTFFEPILTIKNSSATPMDTTTLSQLQHDVNDVLSLLFNSNMYYLP